MNWHSKGSVRCYRRLDSQKKYLYMALQLSQFPFLQIINYLSFFPKRRTAILIIWLLLTPFVYQAGDLSSSQRPGSIFLWRKPKQVPRASLELLADPDSAPLFFLAHLSGHVTFETKTTLWAGASGGRPSTSFFLSPICSLGAFVPLLLTIYKQEQQQSPLHTEQWDPEKGSDSPNPSVRRILLELLIIRFILGLLS